MDTCALVAFLTAFLYLGTAEIIQQLGLFDTNENTKIYKAEILKRITSHSLASCTQNCLSNSLCTSFNYDTLSKSNRFCELYKDDGNAGLVDERGWVCGHLLKRQKLVKSKF